MIIWKGLGILVFIITLVVAVIMQLVLGTEYYQTESWPIPLAIALSAIIVGLLGLNLNNKPGRILLDAKTNEQIEVKKIHSLFWIPMQYWGIILLLISALLFFARKL